MRKQILSNGASLILENRNTASIAINVIIKTGSINEEDKNRGISHFIEHMLFEGTKNRTALQIANEIESLGGSIGAYTSAERTCFYVKILKKHLKTALNVLSDILTNPLFEEKIIEKEKTVILSEIKMKKDEPRFYQWSLFQRSLFKDFPLKNPVIGYEKTVKAINKKDLFDYFNNHYLGSNMVISVVGKTKGSEKQIISAFENIKNGQIPKLKIKSEQIKKRSKIIKEKKPIKQSYIVMGYVAPTRKDKDSYVFDIIQAVLGRGLSGKLFDELRTKRGLGYDVGTHYSDNKHYGFFAAYATIEKKNINLAKKLILEQLQKIDKITQQELKEAKQYIEGEFKLHNEDNEHLADSLSFFEHIGDASAIREYIKNINKIRIKDLIRIKNKYLDKNSYTMVILEQR